MKIPYALLLASIVLNFSGCAPQEESSEDDGWISLFNGNDLTGWETKVEGAD